MPCALSHQSFASMSIIGEQSFCELAEGALDQLFRFNIETNFSEEREHDGEEESKSRIGQWALNIVGFLCSEKWILSSFWCTGHVSA